MTLCGVFVLHRLSLIIPKSSIHLLVGLGRSSIRPWVQKQNKGHHGLWRFFVPFTNRLFWRFLVFLTHSHVVVFQQKDVFLVISCFIKPTKKHPFAASSVGFACFPSVCQGRCPKRFRLDAQTFLAKCCRIVWGHLQSILLGRGPSNRSPPATTLEGIWGSPPTWSSAECDQSPGEAPQFPKAFRWQSHQVLVCSTGLAPSPSFSHPSLLSKPPTQATKKMATPLASWCFSKPKKIKDKDFVNPQSHRAGADQSTHPHQADNSFWCFPCFPLDPQKELPKSHPTNQPNSQNSHNPSPNQHNSPQNTTTCPVSSISIPQNDTPQTPQHPSRTSRPNPPLDVSGACAAGKW